MTIKGYKGFNRDFTCSPNGKSFQYEVGKTYVEKSAKLCKRGFHFCENPLDILNYYPPTARFAEVEAEKVAPAEKGEDKRVSKKLTVECELSLSHILGIGIKMRLDKHDFANAPDSATGDSGAASATGYSGAASATGYSGAASATGDRGAASATGYRGAASATGDRGAASATGDSGAASATGDRGAASATGYRGAASATGDSGAASATGYSGAASATGDRGAASATGYSGAASATGEEGCAIALGVEGKAMGAKGCWLTIAEWKLIDGAYHRVDVKTTKVDGKKIKAEMWYMLTAGQFTEVA